MRTLLNLSTPPAALPEKAAAGVDSLAASAHDGIDRLAGTLASAARQMGAAGQDLLAAERRWAEVSRAAVRRHPFSSVAIAVGVGVLLSRISGR